MGRDGRARGRPLPAPWRSVRVRVTLLATLLVGLTATVAAVALVGMVERRLADGVRQQATAVVDRATALMVAGVAPHDVAFQVPVQVISADGDVIASSPGLPDLAPAVRLGPGAYTVELPEGAVPGQAVATGVGGPVARSGERVEVVTRSLDGPDGPVLVASASPLAEVREGVRALSSALWVVLPLVVLAMAGVSWAIVGRALRPVERLRREVEAIGAGSLHRRVAEPATGDEVDRLARTMNSMLERLESASRRQRRFVSDASHELRSPLATIRARVEVAAARHDPAEWSAAAGTVLAETGRLELLVEDLLELARIDEGADAAPAGPVDLDELVLADVARLRGLGVDVDARGVGAARLAAGRPTGLSCLVRNLLDNAVRHGGGRVAAALRTEGATAVLVVEDDGPGVPEADRERIFDRFARLDESRARERGGAGLGLALVRAVVDQHGGTVAVGDSPLGGARFEVRLPLRAGGRVGRSAAR